ncbi:uncharacterized protein LOC9629796 isoform X2 [Selaginella moellendorffii]|uniref:uncharacterized protein LOC9629796 isoform X2 n=1 Tax=Selaginella moellendorffii TaxID=88036 RepID=UPI000D1C4777|nr:uncharacterized protein LOC9629796 isoform X2 [Selaginella moellendorffii]|eukprot:XP_024517206.1 uncharacterized protein LOC9629796 isoform X2 [Selaginella moellendorffii]
MPMALRFTLFLAVACTMAMFMASARPANIGEEVYDITRQNQEVAGFAEDHPVNTDDHGDLALTLNENCAGKGKSCAPFYIPRGVQCCSGLHCIAVLGVGGWCA